ncbi:Transmembrane protein 17 [Blyttiomyces sp. JEL0837]|nr:Transmembrane protein 17 [Blyttiomyces sp. JEL0837]
MPSKPGSFARLSSSLSMSALQLAAEKVFPGYKGRVVAASHNANRGAIGKVDVVCYVFDQVWLVGQIIVILWKLRWFQPTTFHTILMLFSYCLFILVEPLRLWLGYSGNLRERVPDLAGSFLLTFFPQIFVCFYYMSIQPKLGNGFSVPFEIALNIIYCSLLVPETFLCYQAALAIIKSQAAAFFLTLAEEPEPDVDKKGGREDDDDGMYDVGDKIMATRLLDGA